jgi:hypothetical protein
MGKRNVVLWVCILVLVAMAQVKSEKAQSGSGESSAVQSGMLQPVQETRIYVDELIPCVNRLAIGGWEVARDEKTGIITRLVVIDPGIELRLEKGVAVLGAYVVTESGRAIPYTDRTVDPELHYLGEKDFYQAREKALLECRARGWIKWIKD